MPLSGGMLRWEAPHPAGPRLHMHCRCTINSPGKGFCDAVFQAVMTLCRSRVETLLAAAQLWVRGLAVAAVVPDDSTVVDTIRSLATFIDLHRVEREEAAYKHSSHLIIFVATALRQDLDSPALATDLLDASLPDTALAKYPSAFSRK